MRSKSTGKSRIFTTQNAKSRNGKTNNNSMSYASTSGGTTNVMIFMGNTINLNQQTMPGTSNYTAKVNGSPTLIRSQSQYRSGILKKHPIHTTYRVLATDSNIESGYFQHGFMCPTESSTFQRSKPIAYDLNQITNGLAHFH